MRIWVDADACPNAIKAILFRAAERIGVPLTLVANRHLATPPSRYIRTLQVPSGLDAADRRIAGLVEAGDLVVTADIPLAAEVVQKGGLALDPRGELYTRENVGERLAMRDFMDQLRGSGIDTGGPASLGKSERKAFADQLDRLLAERKSSRGGLNVRREEAADAADIREVNERAFGGPAEADIVDALREHDAVTLSLVAVDAVAVVGHVLFSPVEIETGDSRHAAVALGPMAVRPDRQRRGVGTSLIRRGLELLRAAGHGCVFVVGHPEYYPRFGFAPAGELGLKCPYDVPREAFMLLQLRQGAWSGGPGTVRFRPEFD